MTLSAYSRTRDEVQEMRQTRDPITGFRDRIVGAGLAEISELKAIEGQVNQWLRKIQIFCSFHIIFEHYSFLHNKYIKQK